MRLEIVQTGDPVLRRRAAPIEPRDLDKPFLQELLVSMEQTMREAPGVGLAAPQVGEGLQAFVMGDDERVSQLMSPARLAELERQPFATQVVINPVLEPLDAETVEFFEGCLSVSGFQALVPRWRRVRLRGLDATGAALDWTLTGWPARIAQHEFDHLQGILYLDRMVSRTFTTNANLGRYWKARPAADIRAVVE